MSWTDFAEYRKLDKSRLKGRELAAISLYRGADAADRLLRHIRLFSGGTGLHLANDFAAMDRRRDFAGPQYRGDLFRTHARYHEPQRREDQTPQYRERHGRDALGSVKGRV